MLPFWIIATVLIVITLIAIILSVRGQKSYSDDAQELRVALYRDNLREIESEFQTGQVDPDQLENVKTELELSLLQESHQHKKKPTTSEDNEGLSNSLLTSAMALVIVVMSVFLYLYLGSPELIALNKINYDDIVDNIDNPQSLHATVPLLERHLRRNPQDANGLFFLASTYVALSDHENAVSAFQRLYQLTGDNPQVMMAYVDALIRLNDGTFTDLATGLIHKVLALQPDNYSARLYAGLAAEERGEYSMAIDHFNRLLPTLQDNPQLLQTVNVLITRNQMFLQEQGGGSETAGTVATAGTSTSVYLRVILSDEVVDEVDPEDTLFIYAQASEGSPMPLAVIRRQAGELPVEITIDDTMAMVPNHKLSNFEIVKVQARISKSGNAEVSSGDIVGINENVVVSSEETVEIEINQIIP
jgi:cytochrome c-type biogenesis protein CcmH